MDFLYELILLYKLSKKKILEKSVESKTIIKNNRIPVRRPELKSPAGQGPKGGSPATEWVRKFRPCPFLGWLRLHFRGSAPRGWRLPPCNPPQTRACRLFSGWYRLALALLLAGQEEGQSGVGVFLLSLKWGGRQSPAEAVPPGFQAPALWYSLLFTAVSWDGAIPAVHSLWLLQHHLLSWFFHHCTYISLDDGFCVFNTGFLIGSLGWLSAQIFRCRCKVRSWSWPPGLHPHCHSDFSSAGSPLTGCVSLGGPISNHQLPISQNEGSGYFVGFTKAGGDITTAETQERLVLLRLYLFFFLLLW